MQYEIHGCIYIETANSEIFKRIFYWNTDVPADYIKDFLLNSNFQT